MAVDPFDQRSPVLKAGDREALTKGLMPKPMPNKFGSAEVPGTMFKPHPVLGHDMNDRDKQMVKTLEQALKAIEKGDRPKALDLLTRVLKAKGYSPKGVHAEVERLLQAVVGKFDESELDSQALNVLKDVEEAPAPAGKPAARR